MELPTSAPLLAAGAFAPVAPIPAGAPRQGGGDAAVTDTASGLGSARTDTLELSPLAAALADASDEEGTEEGEAEGTDSSAPRGADGEPLTQEEVDQVRELEKRDQEVRAHEEAHKAAAGDLALGGPTYDYERGPDGREYAVGGEVQIALKKGETPEETIANAQRARRAALAPAEPSAQDYKVAAKAAQLEAEGRQEAAEAEREGDDSEGAAETRAAEDAGSSRELERRASAYAETSQSVQTFGGEAEISSDLLGELMG